MAGQLSRRRRRRPHATPARGRTGGETHQAWTVVDLVAKVALLAFLVLAVLDPDWGNMAGKSPVARAITYPLWSFAIPATWAVLGRSRPFPVIPDALITLTCFTDILGNRLDLYDRVAWFDDWMHFWNVGLLSGALLLLTTRHTTSPVCVLERAVSFGVTAALSWELYEYVGFLTRSAEQATAYSDTLGDLALGWGGAVVAGLLVAASHHRRAASARRCGRWPRGLHRGDDQCHSTAVRS